MINHMTSTTGYLRADGTPNLPLLQETFNRCRPANQGGLQWLDDIRFCRWPGQFTDGKKHDIPGDPNGKARPWENASDCRPYVVDDVIDERKAMLTAAFWRAMVNPGATSSEESAYAVALVEWLVFTKMLSQLVDEVELSADYQEHIGWCLLAPRWKRELGLKRYTLKFSDLEQMAAQAPPNSPWNQLPVLILDPTLEEQAVEFLQGWYDWYVQNQLPEDLRARAPKTTKAQARKAVIALRSEERKASVPLPYLCKNEPSIEALKPYEEAFVPPELTSENEIVFQVERLSEAEVRGRLITDDYDSLWTVEAIRRKGQWTSTTLPTGNPVGVAGLLGQTSTATQTATTSSGKVGEGAIEVVHAIYRAADEDGIPAVYCTTFHRDITKRPNSTGDAGDLYAKHDVVEAPDGDMPYVGCLRERWSRSLTSSRGVTEKAHTDQNLIKGHLDSTLDLASLSVLPPMNVYESPTGQDRTYAYAPGVKNYTRKDREPALMDLSNRAGMINGLEAVSQLTKRLDNRFGSLSEDVPMVRQQLKQEQGVRRHTVAWTLAFKQVLCLYQKHGSDAEFAQVTGAPPGWLDAHRDVPGLLSCVLDFDVREFDPEMEMKRVEAMNKIVLPNDVLGVVNRGAWAADMTRSILGPRRAKLLVRPVPEASAALRDKAKAEIAQMFLGNAPTYLDDKDPTATGLLQYTQEIVTQNPVYLSALDDEALVAVVGAQQAQMIAQTLPRNPNERFSKLLLKWLENLKFIGVTQQQNKQIGRIGVNPEGTQ